MSRNPKRLLTQHEVNLKIISKDPVFHSSGEILNVSGRYRNEDFEIYKTKREQFYHNAKEYKNLNKLALKTNRFKSDIDGDISLKFDFMEKVDETLPDGYKAACVVRKRTSREMHSEFVDEEEVSKCLEPWFRRYWILGRFIRVARKLIIKTRMLKRLNRLQKVTTAMIDQYSLDGFRVINESYPELFEKFLHPIPLESESTSTL